MGLTFLPQSHCSLNAKTIGRASHSRAKPGVTANAASAVGRVVDGKSIRRMVARAGREMKECTASKGGESAGPEEGRPVATTTLKTKVVRVGIRGRERPSNRRDSVGGLDL